MLRVDGLEVGRLERARPGGGARRTAVVTLRGGAHAGAGEDVTFQPPDLVEDLSSLQPVLRGAASLADLWELLDGADLFARPPEHDVVRAYRRWALEAAALDLALRQAALSPSDVLGREPRDVTFVVSPAPGMLRRFPGARLKIDAADLAPGLPVDIVDFKEGGDRALVERALELYPDALLEDPPVAPPGARVSWDVSIRGARDVEALAARPAAVNVKPARIGSLRTLLELYELCAREGIAVYGGGQDELGPGRLQIQLLAALFHPDAPNDVAPSAYNDASPDPRLPRSPLRVERRPRFG